MRPVLPFLFPRPRAVVRQGGVFTLPETVPAVLCVPGADWTIYHAAAEAALEKAGGVVGLRENFLASGVVGAIALGAVDLPPEGYRLEVSERGIRINAPDARGAFYAVQTLAQLLRECDGAVPCVTITDFPDLPVRGFMLDISRCKVPTSATLESLVPQLAALRVNQFQLYTEHTYAFPGHEIVWRDASPMTAPELRRLDQRCRAHGIDLVPNLQSFGHMDRWLKHPPYRHLAECPDGFFYTLTNAHRAAGTLKPDDASAAFAAQLYDAYLPNFTSDQFNIGGDEPWELGQGWSRDLCAARGRHIVYLEHLKRLERAVASRGKRMQFWADVLFEKPELAPEVPSAAVPVIWGYDAGHPFPEQCAALEKLGRDYLVAPGVSSWQTFHGRLDNALTNVNEAVRAALAHGARGVLATSWGDNGNHHPWFVFYPALASAAAQAWCLTANAGVDLARGVGAVFLENDTALARAILDFGRLDACFTKQIRNKSLLWEILCLPAEKLPALLTEVPLGELENACNLCAQWEGVRSEKNPGTTCELAVALQLTRLAIERARLFKSGPPDAAALQNFRDRAGGVVAEYRRGWLLRARPGGLDESVGWLA